jgi:hypothetical protein
MFKQQTSRQRRITIALVAIFIAVISFTQSAHIRAQSATAGLSGTVLDEAGAVVAGVNITIVNADTALKRDAKTGSDGTFAIPLLPPGNYTLTARRDGFSTIEIKNLTLNVSDQVALRIKVKVAGVAATINVEASELAVQSQSAEISGLINERRVRELPLNGKDFNKLVVLAPGVFATPASSNGSPSIGGARTTTNNYMIDGFAANDERVDGLAPGGGFSSLGNAIPNIVSTEAIQEFRIVTSNADATYGRGSGGQISLVTRSGSNLLHGSAYEFLRNDALDARDFFNYGPFRNADGTAKTPPFRQHLYGGTIGGPIVKEKHFFFGSYEGFRQRREITSSLTLPNADLINLMPGDLKRLHNAFYLDTGIIPATGLPAGSSFAPLPATDRTAATRAGFPAALFDGNAANGEAGTLLVSSTVQSDYNQNSFLIRTDHHLTDKLTASVRYGFAQNEAQSGVLTDRIREPRRWQSGVAQFVFTLTPSQLLEVRVGAQRTRNNTLGATKVADKLQQIGIDADKGLFVSLDGTGIRFIRLRGQSAIINNQTIPQAAALHTWTRGNLSLRSGLELRRAHLNYRGGVDIPSFSFFGFVGTTGILGALPAQTQAIADEAFGNVYGANGGPQTAMRGYRTTQQEYFTQADWRVRRDVTLNLGVRYSDFSPYTEVNGALANLYAVDGSGKPVADVSPFQFGRTTNNFFAVGAGRPLYQPDRNNFQPRLGVAWDLGGRGLTVLRLAYGLYYDRIALLEFSDIVSNPPFAIATAAIEVPFRLGAALPIEPDTVNGVAVDPRIRNPKTHRYNVAIEQRLGRDLTVTAAFVGARSRELLRYAAINATGSVPLNRRPDPRFGTESLLRNNSSSDYDSLQVFARRRFSRGVDFTVAYTYSQAYDDVSAAYSFSGAGPALINLGASSASGFQGGGAQFVDRPARSDWGRAAHDVPHNLAISHLIELPFGRGRQFLSNANRFANAVIGGWSFAGIAVLRSGQPFTVTLGSDVNDDGATDDRPMLLSGNLNNLYAGSGVARTQQLIPRASAQALLGTPVPLTDPFVPIARNAFRAHWVKTYDVSLIKRVNITEKFALGFEVNAFNVFNNVNFAAPISALNNARFGEITSTLAGSHGSSANPRQLQLGLKLTF